jgi:hypothetical protein
VNRNSIVLTIGGTQQGLQAAVELFKRRGKDFGAADVKVAPSHERLAPGFDVSVLVS